MNLARFRKLLGKPVTDEEFRRVALSLEKVAARIASLSTTNQTLTTAIKDVVEGSAVELDDDRLRHITLQVDREDWRLLSVLAGLP